MLENDEIRPWRLEKQLISYINLPELNSLILLPLVVKFEDVSFMLINPSQWWKKKWKHAEWLSTQLTYHFVDFPWSHVQSGLRQIECKSFVDMCHRSNNVIFCYEVQSSYELILLRLELSVVNWSCLHMWECTSTEMGRWRIWSFELSDAYCETFIVCIYQWKLINNWAGISCTSELCRIQHTFGVE